MQRVLQILSALTGVFLAVSAFNWMFDPQGAAAGLGMDLLTGMGRNTQIGDMTAFFATSSLFILLGVWQKRPDFLLVPAFLLLSAALFRLTSAQFYDAALIVPAVVFEVVTGIILLAYRREISQ